jgi:hypothetical protein
MDEGFLLIATGENYVKQAKESAKSIKNNSSRPISIVTDREVNSGIFDQVITDEHPTYSFFDKPRNIAETPYDRTVFIDTDAYIVRPVPELFDLLDNYSIATTIDPNGWGGRMHQDVHFQRAPESVPIFQTGVISYKTDEDFRKFRKRWRDIHEQNRDTLLTDQSSFRLAIYNSKIRHLVLSNHYNCLGNWPMQITGNVKIVHKGSDSYKQAKSLESRINTTDSARLLYTENSTIYAPTDRISNTMLRTTHKIIQASSPLSRGVASVNNNGPLATVRKGIKKCKEKLRALY